MFKRIGIAFVAFSILACSGERSSRRNEAYSAWQASAQTPSAQTPSARAATPGPAPHADGSSIERVKNAQTLERTAFVQAVLGSNPSLESARQGWRAALAEESQQVALDDPVLEYAFAPLSIGSSDTRYGQVISLSQRLPWPGKKALAGEVALAEAEVSQENFEAVRLHLALTASLLFDQYYASARSLELNEQHRILVTEIKAAALAQYETGRASQQEPLQAEVELAHVEHEKIVLSTRQAVIVAQMNGLLHQSPETALPPPPAELDLPGLELASPAQLQEEALSSRPELRAQQAKLRGHQAAHELAGRESYPDFGVMASYNSMWAMTEHQWMVGLSLNIPVQVGRRRGRVEQTEARIAETSATLLSTSDKIRVEVEQARQRFVEAGHVLRLYRKRLLPSVRDQIEAARAGYVTGQTNFQALIDSERSLRRVELQYQQALADVGEKRAQLLQTLGRLPGLGETEVTQ